MPDDPRGWLVAVARRRLIDEWRSEGARRRREEEVAALDVPGGAEVSSADDTLTLLFLCCHPSLSIPSQLALTLRAVGGLTTTEIASAFLVPEATMAQRISRAKQTIRRSGVPFELPEGEERAARLRVVMHALYLIFNEGYSATSGRQLARVDRTAEAIRLARMLHRLVPGEGEAAGLLALMLLTDARRTARVDADGLPVPLGEQRRERWDADEIREGLDLLERTLGKGTVGPYQLQAAIAAVHDEAETAEDTDWREIVALYRVLEAVAPSPIVTLNRAVAVAMVDGPEPALDLIRTVEHDPALARSHRLHSVRAHLLERAGHVEAARDAYRLAARMATSEPERRYLTIRAARL